MAEKLWSDDELRIALGAYLDRMAAVAAGGSHSPTAFHRELSAKHLPGRTEGSVARRMSNISWVLSSSGLPHFDRYAPSLKQAGTGVSTRLLAIYEELVGEVALEADVFDAKVAALVDGPPLPPPLGSDKPASTTGTVVRYARSAAVAAWVLQTADGVCEACNAPAPFTRASGVPYLEVHHLHRLADGGPDTIENAVAVCPNCHRRLHLGSDAAELTAHVRKGLRRSPAR